MEKTTISVQELSAQMGISLPKAYELVKTPGFPTIRIGARILIPIKAYKEWLPCEWSDEDIDTPVFDSYMDTLTNGDEMVKQLLICKNKQ